MVVEVQHLNSAFIAPLACNFLFQGFETKDSSTCFCEVLNKELSDKQVWAHVAMVNRLNL